MEKENQFMQHGKRFKNRFLENVKIGSSEGCWATVHRSIVSGMSRDGR